MQDEEQVGGDAGEQPAQTETSIETPGGTQVDETTSPSPEPEPETGEDTEPEEG